MHFHSLFNFLKNFKLFNDIRKLKAVEWKIGINKYGNTFKNRTNFTIFVLEIKQNH